MLNNMNKYLTPHAIVNAILVTVVTVGAGILVTKITGPLPISVSQTLAEMPTTFDTTGDAEIVAIPDEAQVSLGIETSNKTASEAQSIANKVINDITDAVKKLGVDKKDIKTQNYNLSSEYDYSSSERRLIGYRVSTQIVVKINDFEKLNQVIDAATSLGANQVGGISFNLSEAKQAELKKEARQEAIDKAKKNAKELAKLTGIKLGRVVNVTEFNDDDYYPQPIYAREEMVMNDDEFKTPTQIEPGSKTYRYNVTLSYETL